MPTLLDSLLGRLARAARPRHPWLRVTVSPWWAQVLIAAGARPAPVDAIAFAHPAPTIGPRAHLIGIMLIDVDLTDVDLTGANLTGANLTRADLARADLTGANLTDAYLSGANLTDAILTNANLNGANLRRAVLIRANLTGTDLSGAYLPDPKMTHAVWDDQTQWPSLAWVRRMRMASVRLPGGRWRVQVEHPPEGASQDASGVS